jgi:hypothetical protein
MDDRFEINTAIRSAISRWGGYDTALAWKLHGDGSIVVMWITDAAPGYAVSKHVLRRVDNGVPVLENHYVAYGIHSERANETYETA